MRVAHIPHYDGNPYQTELATALRRRGVDLTLLSGYPVSTLRGLVRRRPGVVHFHWVSPFLVGDDPVRTRLKAAAFLSSVAALKAAGVDVVWTVHNILEHERRHPDLELAAKRRFAALCDGVIVHCRAAEARAREAFEIESTPVFVVPHGHYLDTYQNSVSRTEARRALELDDAGLVYLYLGQIRPYKQVVPLIEAFGGLDGDDTRLVVAGNPQVEGIGEAVRTRAAADPRVRVDLGYVPDEEIQRYMNAADAVVLPHEDVLTSGSAILAMSFGRPVIAPTHGCLPETLSQQAALLYDPETDTLAEALRAAEREDLAAAGARNLDRVRSFDWDGIAERTEAVYRDVRSR